MDTMACPHCGQTLQITPELLGIKVQCPKCSKTFSVPRQMPAAGPPPMPPAEAPPPIQPPPEHPAQRPAGTSGVSYQHPEEYTGPGGAGQQPYGGAKIMAPGAVASLVYGILALFICGIIFGLVAVSKGKQAREVCRSDPDRFTGAGLALTGTILGWVGFIGALLFLLIRLGSALGK